MTSSRPTVSPKLALRPKLSGFDPKFGVNQAKVAAEAVKLLPDDQVIGREDEDLQRKANTVLNALKNLHRVFSDFEIVVRQRMKMSPAQQRVGRDAFWAAELLCDHPATLAAEAKTTYFLHLVVNETIAELKRLGLLIETDKPDDPPSA